MRVALDTNILAYAEGLGDERRVSQTRQLLTQISPERVVLPAQTLGELYRVLTGKANHEPAAARDAVLEWRDAFEVADSTTVCFLSALDLAVDHQLQFWDSLILAIAAQARCRVLLSEDKQQGFTWGGVTVVNPYSTDSHALLEQLLAGVLESE
jgi:predicted nucleic acid-binding protein